MVQTANEIFRDFETDGVMASGRHEPKKSEIRPWGTRLESLYSAAQAGGGLAYETKAAMDADLAHDANQIAWVMEDPTAASNGIYQKVGASGSGSWNRLGDLPYSYIKASNAGAGTANAIVATTSMPIPAADGGALIALPIVATNDASPVTVSFNGGAALTVKTSSGNDVSVGGLTAGMIAAGYVSGTTFRLLSDQAGAAIVAAAEAAANRAEAAAASIDYLTVADRTALKAVDTAKHTVVYLRESGREGIYQWNPANLSAEVDADPSEYTYVAPSNDPTGASGAWVFVDALDLRFDPATNAILPKNHSDFSLINPVIKFGENLSGYDSWVNATPDPQGYNVEGLSVDLGGYGPTSYGIYSAVSSIIGKVKVPAASNFRQANAIEGTIISDSPEVNSVALYGQALLRANNQTVWSGNTGASAGADYTGTTAIGWEFDVSVFNPKQRAVGIYIVGASTVAPDGSVGVSRGAQVSPLGVFADTVIPWDVAYGSVEGAAKIFAEIRPKLRAASASQDIQWYYTPSNGIVTKGPLCYVDQNGNWFFSGSPAGKATYFQTYSGGLIKTPLAVAGESVSINGGGLSYNLSVMGSTKLDGPVGFQGSNPIEKPDVTGSVAGNAALTSLLTALASYGLITNSTTA